MSDIAAQRLAGGPRDPVDAQRIRSGQVDPTVRRPDPLKRPAKKRDQAVPPELQQLAAQFGIDPAVLAASGGASDRLTLLGIPDALANSPVLLRGGDATTLGTAPTIGMSDYRWPERSTILDTLEDFWDSTAGDQAALIDLQQRLWAGGFYGEGDAPAFGADLTRTFDAYRDAVILAAQSGQSLMDDILSADNQTPAQSVTNREDIRVLMERVAPEVIGRGLSAEEMERAVTAWHAAQQSTPEAGQEPMSEAALADVALGEVAPGEEESFDFARRSFEFLQLLESPVD